MENTTEQAIEQVENLKPYEAPELIEYGSVAALTQSGAVSVANDGQTHKSRRP